MLGMNGTQDILAQLGDRVRQLRVSKGLSQEKLADICGLDRTYISGVERGKRNVGLLNIATIAESLGVSISELFSGIG